MALRNQPYLPLYIQDYLTDEKLNECSLSTQGIYIKLMCILHKSDEYGVILLKQKDKQNNNQALNFAIKISKQLPIELIEIQRAIEELANEKVIFIDGDKLIQKRMVKDNAISEARSKAGSKGGFKTQSFAKAKKKANTEDENESEDEDINKDEIVYPFDSETFLDAWKLWKKFKKEQFKFTYKNIGEQSALIKLSKISNLNDEIAIKIIIQSIENGWKGLFELKDNNNGQSTTEEAVRSVAEDLEREILNSDTEPE